MKAKLSMKRRNETGSRRSLRSVCRLPSELAREVDYFKEEPTMAGMREGEIRIPSGCAIAAVISREGKKMTGEAIMESMKPMHDRSNGLGGGFAGYGIYPECKDY